MSQQGKRKTKRFLDFQARNQLGIPGAKSFLRGGQIFEIQYVQYYQNTSNTFFMGGENFSRGVFAPLVTGLWTSIHYKKQTFSCVLLCAFSILV